MTTIVQLSDTHVTAPDRRAYGRVDTRDALRRAVAHINALPERVGPIDAVMVSGDLTDLGADAEFQGFRALTRDLAPPLFVLPGNHDRRDALRRAFPDAPYLPGGDGPLDYAVKIGDLQVIALDSTVPGEPHGLLEEDQLAWLDTALTGARETAILVFLHHPPFDTGIAHMDRQQLLNADALLDRLRARPQVRLVASGHVHRAISTMVDGLACMIAPSPSHAVRLDLAEDAAPAFELEPGAVVVHRWRDGRLLSHLSYIDAGEGPYPFFDGAGTIVT